MLLHQCSESHFHFMKHRNGIFIWDRITIPTWKSLVFILDLEIYRKEIIVLSFGYFAKMQILGYMEIFIENWKIYKLNLAIFSNKPSSMPSKVSSKARDKNLVLVKWSKTHWNFFKFSFGALNIPVFMSLKNLKNWFYEIGTCSRLFELMKLILKHHRRVFYITVHPQLHSCSQYLSDSAFYFFFVQFSSFSRVIRWIKKNCLSESFVSRNTSFLSTATTFTPTFDTLMTECAPKQPRRSPRSDDKTVEASARRWLSAL